MRPGSGDHDAQPAKGEEDFFLPPPNHVTAGPDEKGIKKLTEHKYNDGGHKVKITTNKEEITLECPKDPAGGGDSGALLGKEGTSTHNTLGYEAGDGQPLKEGYVMVCWFCGSENCGSGVNHPVRMRCYVCREHGKHSSWNCPTGRYRGPPMLERYACSNWDDA